MHHPAAVNQIFLVSDGENLTIRDLLQRTASAYRIPPRLLPVPVFLLRAIGRIFGKTEMVQRLCDNLQVDNEKSQRLLGWEPPISIGAELTKTAQRWLVE